MQNDVTAYLRGRGTDEWRKAFVPLMSGLVTDQGKQWSSLLGIEFDIRNIEGEAWFQDYTLDFARNCTLRAEEAVRSVIEVGLAEGWSVPNMQNHLTMVFRQWQNGGGTPDEFAWFTERMPAHRTEMIARIETIRAGSRGNEQQFARWGVEGKEWLTAHDERLCPWCAEMDGKLVNVTEPFFLQGDVFEVQVGEKVAALHLDYEDVTSPPLHPNCRCTLLPWKREWEEIGVEPPERLEEWVGAEVEEPIVALMHEAVLKPIREANYKKGVFDSTRVEIEGNGTGILKPEPAAKDKYRKKFGLEKDYNFADREALAYEMAQVLGFDGMVPPTVVREVEGRLSSLQLWIDGAIVGDKMDRPQYELITEQQVKNMLMFDSVTGNFDRHGGNFLYKDGGVIAIDHGLAFSNSTEIYTHKGQELRGFWQFWHPQLQWTVEDYDSILERATSPAAVQLVEQTLTPKYQSAYWQRISKLEEERKLLAT